MREIPTPPPTYHYILRLGQSEKCLDMEIHVKQRTEEWYEVRQEVVLTASRFGEALGVGKGRPYDFFLSLVSDDPLYKGENGNSFTQHGIDMERIIDEMYGLLTGYRTEEAGFWVPDPTSILYGLCGASPDGKVFFGSETQPAGLVEYKAPVNYLYSKQKHPPHGIPRSYMAQIQGQMAFSGLPWCDFMAVCTATREVMLKRVHFHHKYWNFLANRLRQFCLAVKEARRRKERGLPFDKVPGVPVLRQLQMSKNLFPGEADIVVGDLLKVNERGQYKSTAGWWMDYDFLMGITPEPSPVFPPHLSAILSRIDAEIDQKNSQKNKPLTIEGS